jgi:hypothetical protein
MKGDKFGASVMYQAKRLTGRCANGAERGGGHVYHAVPGGDWATALCGAKPGRLSAGWDGYESREGEPHNLVKHVTCQRCLHRLARR